MVRGEDCCLTLGRVTSGSGAAVIRSQAEAKKIRQVRLAGLVAVILHQAFLPTSRPQLLLQLSLPAGNLRLPPLTMRGLTTEVKPDLSLLPCRLWCLSPRPPEPEQPAGKPRQGFASLLASPSRPPQPQSSPLQV